MFSRHEHYERKQSIYFLFTIDIPILDLEIPSLSHFEKLKRTRNTISTHILEKNKGGRKQFYPLGPHTHIVMYDSK